METGYSFHLVVCDIGMSIGLMLNSLLACHHEVINIDNVFDAGEVMWPPLGVLRIELWYTKHIIQQFEFVFRCE